MHKLELIAHWRDCNGNAKISFSFSDAGDGASKDKSTCFAFSFLVRCSREKDAMKCYTGRLAGDTGYRNTAEVS